MSGKKEGAQFKFVRKVIGPLTFRRRSALRLRGGGGSKRHVGDLDEKVQSALRIYPASSTLIQKSISKFIEDHHEHDADSWTWESYTPEESIKEEEREKAKKSKKGKKAAETSPAIDNDEGKKKKKEALTAAELRLAEQAAREEEEAERLRLKQEQKIAAEKEKKETAEQALRTEQLQSSLHLIDTISKRYVEAGWKQRDEIEWVQYLKCDGLPNPCLCGQMSTYLQLWDETIENTTMEQATSRTSEVLKLLEELTNFVDNPLGASSRKIENWRWICGLFRERQQRSLDIASYRILRDISNKMNNIQLVKADFNIVEEQFTICLWTMVSVPKSYPNPRAPPRPRVEVAFPQLKMNVLLPAIIDCYLLALRTMYVKYDHLSDSCASYHEPEIPDAYSENIYHSTLNEWYSKLIYKYEQYRVIKKAEGVSVPKQEYDREAGIMPQVPYARMPVSPSTHIISEEDVLYGELRQSFITTVEPNVVNLRKHIILGGIFFVELYFQPPQPQLLVSMEMSITRLLVPKFLKEVKFRVPYKAPAPAPAPSSTTAGGQRSDPSELEAENKKLEAEMDKLIFVSLDLPDHVMWLDTPFVCQWQRDRNVWSTVDIHDFKYLEESASVTFRTTSFGCFAFALNRHTNLPFQTWDLKPELNGSVTLQLTSAILVIDFNILGDDITVAQMQNAPNQAFKPYLGKYFKLPKLKRILLELGVDVFPCFDAFCYVKESCEKHWPMEKHAYYQMAQLSCCYNFAWSRWNSVVGRRGVIMQMREYKPERNKQVPYSMLHITPLKAEIITCTEVSPAFLPEPAEGMLFYADLYSLFKGTCSMIQRTKVQNTSPLLIGTVSELLRSTRVLSFS
ncbi:hypothetical protein PPYR_04773 [Photinus pyralis]|uniref:IC97/Casc1 N-terminal domain-containing protein n=2 Tax=Photinus pyralis TaxID=7054 RepID=A0A5N4AZ10_PHOPY|nr:axonemal 84 kDa protein-like isoform X2 [Photinus pyralis]KAB0802587.1 hypothetical protein PPYR_04773 [Photinus pyralis]